MEKLPNINVKSAHQLNNQQNTQNDGTKKAKYILAGTALAAIVATGAAYFSGKKTLSADTFEASQKLAGDNKGKIKFIDAVKQGYTNAFNKVKNIFKSKDKVQPETPNKAGQEAVETPTVKPTEAPVPTAAPVAKPTEAPAPTFSPEEIKAEALQRNAQAEQIEHAQKTQDELMEVLHPQTPTKSAQESADVIEAALKRQEAIEESLHRGDKTVTQRVYDVKRNITDTFNVARKREQCLKNMKPETLAGLSDEQIELLLTTAGDKNINDIIKILETEFTPEELRIKSLSPLSSAFIGNLFDIKRGTLSLEEFLKYYKR